MISHERPLDPKTSKKLREMFPDMVAEDECNHLVEVGEEIPAAKLKELANEAKQPITLSLMKPGETTTLSDGTVYEVTPKGWVKRASPEGGREEER